MNIFYLSETPTECAKFHVDKHTVKMILEYAQLLCTTHRVVDGVETQSVSPSGRKQKIWVLKDKEMDDLLYKATHINHPSAVWVRYSVENYRWLYNLFIALQKEYTFRYGKVHACSKLNSALENCPTKLPFRGFTQPTPAMPADYIKENSIESYRAYYKGSKSNMFSWKNRETPSWITT